MVKSAILEKIELVFKMILDGLIQDAGGLAKAKICSRLRVLQVYLYR